MITHEGKCIGGPLDGQMLVHYSEKKEFFEPFIRYQGLMRLEDQNVEIIPIKIGEYYWANNFRWMWLPEGKQSRRK